MPISIEVNYIYSKVIDDYIGIGLDIIDQL